MNPQLVIARRQSSIRYVVMADRNVDASDRGGDPGGVMANDDRCDFFISYTAVDSSWAEWIAATLEQHGHSTQLQAWDFRPGSDFMHMIHEAVRTADRTIAVLTQSYFSSTFGEVEWRAAFARDPTGALGLLIPIRVQPCQPPGLLATRVYIDLVDLDEDAARFRLLDGIKSKAERPSNVGFPGIKTAPTPQHHEVHFPGAGSSISNLPARNLRFIGRENFVAQLRSEFGNWSANSEVAIVAVHGLGGIGKSDLALEFAHRFSGDYQLVWWIPAERPSEATAILAQLATRLGAASLPSQREMVQALFDRLRDHTKWLLIYDNVEHPRSLDGLLPPGGNGQILITSRWATWGRIAKPIRIDVLTRGESVAFLARRIGSAEQRGLNELAELLGDLPLALEEAGAYLEETQESLAIYLQLVEERAADVFGRPGDHVETVASSQAVATVWQISFDRIHNGAPDAEGLLSLLAFLDPDVPRDIISASAAAMPVELADVARDPLAINRTLAAIARYSLATVTPTTVSLHRLVQMVIRGRLTSSRESYWASAAVELLLRTFPNESWEPKTWSTCEALLPHLLSAAAHAERLGVRKAEAGWLLSRASAYLRERGHFNLAQPLAERALETTQADPNPSAEEIGWRHNELGRVLEEHGHYTQARDEYIIALELIKTALGEDHFNTGLVQNELGRITHELGDLPKANLHLRRALKVSEPVLGSDHANVISMRNNLGRVLEAMGDLQAARAEFESAVLASEADHPRTGVLHNNLGHVMGQLGDYEGAQAQYELAVAVTEAALGPDHPDVGIWCNNLGEILQKLGRFPEALIQLERSLRIREAALGPHHRMVASSHNNLGLLARESGDLTKARADFERALEIGHATWGLGHPQLRTLYNNLGRICQELGDHDAALQHWRSALADASSTPRFGDPDLGVLHNNIALILCEREDFQSANTHWRQALSIWAKGESNYSLEVAAAHGNVGYTEWRLGNLASAKRELEAAISMGEGLLGTDDGNIGVWRNNLGRVLRELGQLHEAVAEFSRALAIAVATVGPRDPIVAAMRQDLVDAWQRLGIS